MLRLASALGGLRQAQDLSYEEMLVLTATLDHQERTARLEEQLAGLYATPPQPGDTPEAAAAEAEWWEAFADTEAQLAAEADCWFYPLDHPRGERLTDTAAVPTGDEGGHGDPPHQEAQA